MPPEYDILSDEGVFAGYVDSGLWELEEWLARRDRNLLHFWMSFQDSDED